MPRAGSWREWFAVALTRVLVRFARRPRAGTPQRVLVIRVDERVGNVLLTTPLLANLRDHLPGATLDVLVARSKARLLSGTYSVLPFEKRDFSSKPGRFLQTLLRIRRSDYDVVIDASHSHAFSSTSALLTAWTGAPMRIGHGRPLGVHPAASHNVPVLVDRYEPLQKQDLARPLGATLKVFPMHTTLGTQSESLTSVADWLRGVAKGRPVLALWPGARKVDHRAPRAVFVRLAEVARRAGWAPIVLWGPAEADWARQVASEGDAALAPSMDLGRLAALMRQVSVVASNDTGPMHLSVSVGTPTLGIFVMPDAPRWGHPNAPHRVVAGAGLSEDALAAAAVQEAERMFRAAIPCV